MARSASGNEYEYDCRLFCSALGNVFLSPVAVLNPAASGSGVVVGAGGGGEEESADAGVVVAAASEPVTAA
jgi:hypothetical protein